MQQLLYVVAFPVLAGADLERIEAWRARHDPAGHALLRAHFTFVFGCTGVSAASLESAVAATAAGIRPIEFCLTRAVSSAHGGWHYVFLCPDQGAAEMLELHRRLHAGPLAACLDADQEFTPHLTVCKTQDAGQARQVLDSLRDDPPRIAGQLDALAVGRLQDGRFGILREVPLACPRA